MKSRIPPPRTTAESPATVEFVRPVAAPVRIEQQLAALQDQLDVLKAQVRQAQQLAGLGTAAATIAHEVNNLLTPILSYAQAALDSNDPGLGTRALTLTVKHVRMLVAMTDRILQITAASAARCEPVHVFQAVEDARQSLCRDLAKDGIRFVNRIDESMAVLADALQLQQVLFNLFLNAREAMANARNGILSVSARCESDRVRIEVHNTGPPIPAMLLPHVFESLQSSKSGGAAGKRRCSGLGLALCRDLVEENQGRISVASSEEGGTVFTIELPAATRSPAAGLAP